MENNFTNKPDKRSLIAGFSGNVLEWYDFTVYGFFATVIGAQFFPHQDKIVQLISALGCRLAISDFKASPRTIGGRRIYRVYFVSC
jgi:hypothetical protein